MANIIILLGAPGAGKGTQAARLCVARSLPHISTGDLFRANIQQASPIGLRAKEYMDAGRLVPDEVVLDMLTERVAAPDCRDGYLLDGFPRTLEQAEALGARLGNGDSLCVVNIEVSDDTIVKRASGRLLCRTCANIQHLEFSPPKTPGVCDADGGELFQRKDDSPEVVGERLRVYHEQTKPLVRFYTDQGVLEGINGEQSPDDVYADLGAALSECV